MDRQNIREDKNDHVLPFNQIVHNGLIVGIAFFLSSIAQFGFFLLITHQLPQTHVDLFELGRSSLEIGAGILGPGLVTFIIREIGKDRQWWIDNHWIIKKYLIRTSIVVSGLVFFSLFFSLDSWFSSLVIAFFCVAIVFQNLNDFYEAFFRSRDQFQYLSSINVLSSIASVCVGILVLFYAPNPLLGIACTILLRWVLQSLFLSQTAKKYLYSFSTRSFTLRFYDLVSEIFPLSIGTIAFIIYSRVDVLMLEWLGYSHTISLYGAAFRPIGFLIALLVSFIQVFLPSLSRLLAVDKKSAVVLAAQYALGFGVVGVILALLIQTFRIELIELLYPDTFRSSVHALPALLWTLPIILVGNCFGSLLVYGGRQGTLYYAVISIIGLMINVSGNLLVIPTYHFVGAAWITFATDLITTLLMILSTLFLLHRTR